MNGPPTSAVYLSPSERRKRREEPFAQMLAEKPLNEVRKPHTHIAHSTVAWDRHTLPSATSRGQ